VSGAVVTTILGLTVRSVSAVDGALLRLAYTNFERTLMEYFLSRESRSFGNQVFTLWFSCDVKGILMVSFRKFILL
jgi:hypothetical protein